MRIMIFGRPGSGKSTFATHLHHRLDIPLYHLDKYFFIDNWQERPYEDFLSIQQKIVQTPAWIIDGNSTRSLEMRYQRADICIYFNYARHICLWRLCKRYFMRTRSIDDRAPNCPEKISWKLIRYMWTFHTRVKPSIFALQQTYPHVKFMEVTSSDDLIKIQKTILDLIT